jgi:hypothetical protein
LPSPLRKVSIGREPSLLDTYDGAWVNEAAARGVFAYIVDTRPEELQSAPS